MPPKFYCHFCGRSDSLHEIPDTRARVCSKCWEIIAHIVSKWSEVNEHILKKECNEQPH